MGELADARAHLEQMLAMYDADRHGELTTLMADEPRIGPMCYLAVTLSLLGFLKQAMALVKQARELEAKVTNGFARGMCTFVMRVAPDGLPRHGTSAAQRRRARSDRS